MSSTFNPGRPARGGMDAATLTDENTRFLERLPVTFVIGDYTLVHASPREPIWEYILEPSVAGVELSHISRRPIVSSAIPISR